MRIGAEVIHPLFDYVHINFSHFVQYSFTMMPDFIKLNGFFIFSLDKDCEMFSFGIILNTFSIIVDSKFGAFFVDCNNI